MDQRRDFDRMNTGSFQHNQGGGEMPAIVQFPAVVQEALEQFGEPVSYTHLTLPMNREV